MNDWERLKPDIEVRLEELCKHVDHRKWNRFIGLWEKLDPIDSVYFQYCRDGEDRYRYYVERYMADKKFRDKIEQIFQRSVYELNAGNILEMWRYLQEEEKEDGFAGRVKEKLRSSQRISIQRKLQKYAQPGVEIRQEKMELYLELLVGQKKRQKQILEAEEKVPAELLCYFDEHGKDLEEVQNRCLILDYCVSHLDSFGFEQEESEFWKNLMIDAVTRFPAEILENVRELLHGMDRRESI